MSTHRARKMFITGRRTLAAFCLTVTLAACGGGNSTPPPPAPTTPGISSFTPTSGAVSTPVTLSGLRFTGATSVKFNGTTATFTIVSSTQITTTVPTGATTGKISVTTPAGTASSLANFTVTGTSGALDLTIEGLYVTQATQDYPTPSVPLVKDRSAWVRVFAKASQTNTATPQVRVRFVNGSTTNTLTINSTLSSVPTFVDPNTLTSWNVAVPSSWILAGTQVIADVDPTNAIAESNEANNSFTANLDVRTLKPWKITLVPVKTGTRTGVVTSASRTKESWLDLAKRLHPVPDAIDIAVGSVMTSSVTTLQSSGGTTWSTVLNEVSAKRSADGATDRYYYGVVNVSYTSGVAGLGFIGDPAAVGWDFFPSATEVLAHEEGHNFNRQHSPCGNASNPDPAYPYPSGGIGVPGWDVFATSGNLKNADVYKDIMGYCDPNWISDYTYKNELSYRASSPLGIVVNAQSGTAKDGLLIWGKIEDGVVTLEPAFRVPFKGEQVVPGAYTIEARGLAGQLLQSQSFEAHEVADVPEGSVHLFSFILPMTEEGLNNVASLRLIDADGAELTHRVTRASASEMAQSAQRGFAREEVETLDLPDRSVQLRWDADRYPVIMVRDAATGEVRGFLRGGLADIADAPAELDIQASDGVRSQHQRHVRSTE